MTLEQEKRVIVKALICFWSCKACHYLHWDANCKDKDECGERLYRLLEQHFKKVKKNE